MMMIIMIIMKVIMTILLTIAIVNEASMPLFIVTAFGEAVPDGWEVMWRHCLRWRPIWAEAGI